MVPDKQSPNCGRWCLIVPQTPTMHLLLLPHLSTLLVADPQRMPQQMLQPTGFIRRAGGVPLLAAAKYGVDPRSQSQVASARDGLRFRLSRGAGLESCPFRLVPGKIGILTSVEDLADAVAAASTDRFVCLKFWREGCPACASTVESFAALAERHALTGEFFLVNFDTAKPLCRKSRLGVIPTAHIYMNGALIDTMGLGKGAWDPFVDRIDELAAELAASNHESDEGSLLAH